jgi:DNA polymerase-1
MNVLHTKKRIVLLDMHAIIHRAYHALPDFRASDGKPTGALYGLCSIIASIFRELEPDYVIACYDLPGNTFRHDVYTEYKGNRSKTDDDLVLQLISSRDIVNALNIPIYDAPGFEADDVIGTIAKGLSDKDKYDIIIASGDMDTMQLIEEKHIRVFTFKKSINETVLLDAAYIQDRFGFEPLSICDYKALRGDPSDNIPGVPGVGEKTATILIQKFKTIEHLYENLEKTQDPEYYGVSKRIIGLLLEHKESSFFSKMLATIRHDAPVNFVLPESVWKESFDKELADVVFKKYEFKTMLDKFYNIANVAVNKTDNKKPKIDKIIKSKKEDFHFPDFDKTVFCEAQIMLWLLNSEKTNAKEIDMYEYTGEKLLKDAHIFLSGSLKKIPELFELYTNLEKPLISVLDFMEKKGIVVDRDYLQNASLEIHKKLKILESTIYEYVGSDCNINSPKQLSVALFETLALPTKGLKKRKDGLYSTDIDTLLKIKELHPVVESIILYRELEKMRSTYIDALPQYLADDAILHPDFLITGTTTGRMSSQNPNVQNIPVRGEYGPLIRRAFKSRDGYSLVAFDYSQIELRFAALLSGDEYFLQVFKNGRDIHHEVAKKVYALTDEEITKDMRRHAKVINFGILYGMGSSALASEMGVSKKEAKEYIDKYFSEFPHIAVYLDSVIKDAMLYGYTKTITKRRRQIPAINSHISFIKEMAKRAAINAPIQGSAADLVRFALLNVFTYLKQNALLDYAYPVLQIHDEIIFEIEDSRIEDVSIEIKNIMENSLDVEKYGISNSIPFSTQIHVGKNWGDMV